MSVTKEELAQSYLTIAEPVIEKFNQAADISKISSTLQKTLYNLIVEAYQNSPKAVNTIFARLADINEDVDLSDLSDHNVANYPGLNDAERARLEAYLFLFFSTHHFLINENLSDEERDHDDLASYAKAFNRDPEARIANEETLSPKARAAQIVFDAMSNLKERITAADPEFSQRFFGNDYASEMADLQEMINRLKAEDTAKAAQSAPQPA